MLPKINRLNSVEFNHLFSTGKKIHSPTFFVVFDPEYKESPAKFAVSASKKIFKRAVDRSKIRRQVYAHIRTTTELDSGSYIIVIKQNPTDMGVLTDVLNNVRANH